MTEADIILPVAMTRRSTTLFISHLYSSIVEAVKMCIQRTNYTERNDRMINTLDARK